MKIKRGSGKIIDHVRNTVLVVVGTFVLAFGTGLFIIPFDLVNGGVSGLGIIAEKAFSFIPFLSLFSATFYASVFNWMLFVLGFILLGKSFAANTLVSTLVYPLALALAVSLSEGSAFGGFFNLHSELYSSYGELPVIIAAVFGGAMIGAGCAITFIGGGSTGGIDVLALIISKYFKSMKSSASMFLCDSLVIVLGMFAIGDLIVSLLGILSAFIAALAIDKLFIGESMALTAYVISDRCDDINESIISRLDRTATIIPCKGGYSGDDKQLLMTTFSVSQYAEFTAIVAAVDKRAFVTVHRAHEINGEGWSYASPAPIPEKGETLDNSQN